MVLDKVKLKTINNNSLIGDGNITVGGSSVDIVTSWENTLSDTKVPSEKLAKNSLDAKADSSSLAAVATSGSYADLSNKPTIPTDVSDLTDTQNTAFTPKSHSHGNLSSDGKLGSNANYFVYTTTSGQVTSKQKIGNITTSGAIGSTSGLPIITTSSGVLTTGSFGSTAGTFAEGNHTHSSYISTSSTAGLIKNDGSIDTNTYLTQHQSLTDYVQKSNGANTMTDSSAYSTIGTSANATQKTINAAIDSKLDDIYDTFLCENLLFDENDYLGG